MNRKLICATLAAAVLALPGGANAQTTGDLSQLLITADALGDGWSASLHGADNVIILNSAAARPSAGYGGLFSNGNANVVVTLYAYPDRATALARLDTDKQDEFGHLTTEFDSVTGFGDGPAYEAVGGAMTVKGPGLGLAFVDNNIVVYVDGRGFDTQDDANTFVTQAGSAQDALLQGNAPS